MAPQPPAAAACHHRPAPPRGRTACGPPRPLSAPPRLSPACPRHPKSRRPAGAAPRWGPARRRNRRRPPPPRLLPPRSSRRPGAAPAACAQAWMRCHPSSSWRCSSGVENSGERWEQAAEAAAGCGGSGGKCWAGVALPSARDRHHLRPMAPSRAACRPPSSAPAPAGLPGGPLVVPVALIVEGHILAGLIFLLLRLGQRLPLLARPLAPATACHLKQLAVQAAVAVRHLGRVLQCARGRQVPR